MRADRYAKNSKSHRRSLFHVFQDTHAAFRMGIGRYALPSALFSLDRCCDRGTGDRLVSSGRLSGSGKDPFCGAGCFFAALCDRGLSYGWLYGYQGCSKFLSGQREKTGDLKRSSYRCLCRYPLAIISLACPWICFCH